MANNIALSIMDVIVNIKDQFVKLFLMPYVYMHHHPTIKIILGITVLLIGILIIALLIKHRKIFKYIQYT